MFSRVRQRCRAALESPDLWRWALASLAIQCVYSLFNWRQAFFYTAHRYFAHQVLDGLDPYSIVGCVPEAPGAVLHFLPPRLLIHSGLFWGEDVTGWPMYLLFQWLMLAVSVLLIRALKRRQILREETAQVLYCLTAFNPGLVALCVILLGDWVLAIPLVLGVLLFMERSPAVGALVAGLSVGWSVAMIFLGPIVVMQSAHRNARTMSRRLLLPSVAWLIGVACTVAPYPFRGVVGPERWFYAQSDTFSWFSIWSALGDFYVPQTSLVIMTLAVAVFSGLYAMGRLTLNATLILSVVASSLFSNYAPNQVICVAGVLVVIGISDRRGSRLIGGFVWLQMQMIVTWRIINGHLFDDRFMLFFSDHRHGFALDGFEGLVLWAPVLLGAGWVLVHERPSTASPGEALVSA